MNKTYRKIQSKYGRRKIMEIQRFLKDFGFLRGVVDGFYGKHTAAAVAAYQRIHPPLIPDGIIGRKTLKVMFPKKRAGTRVITKSSDIYDTTICKSKFPKEDRGEQRALKRFYGDPSKNEIGKQLIAMKLPYTMYLSWNASIGTNRIFMHKKVTEAFQGFFEDIKKKYDKDERYILGLDQYGGAYNHRRMRGANRWSTHAYGIALDLDPAHNQLRWHKPKARFSREQYEPIWKIAAEHGLYSLGVHHNYDYMHIQAAWRK